ncbi:Hypothetical Protein FCC1311_069222 [Hondaea fermentalgiana]|uniref:Uncharacterized protein n=1 Tax=Hondaea fermentalgiana TaxID=2315210 RepID=A0A2R5GII4_9STRA|nr:Hypothetical Protein FCC1311_069222 [Hondaea fermentalgiana]|eukprot:GBG30702.1 Hypothetical Protein FCC1311_069222 [Hondaea fermentalgiana]
MDGVQWRSETRPAGAKDIVATLEGQHNVSQAWQARREARSHDYESKRSDMYCRLCAGGLRLGESKCSHETCRHARPNAQAEARAHFVQKALARREEKLGDYGAAARKNAAARKRVLEQKEMSAADREAHQAAVEAVLAQARRARFEEARDILATRIENGFSPSVAYGRRQYFARTGLSRKAARLPVKKI